MKQINPKHTDALKQLINNSPYFKLLSMQVCEIGPGCSTVKVDMQRKHCNPFGTIHGGVFFSMIDTAAYLAVYCELDEELGYTTLDLSVSNLANIHEGKIIVEGKSIKIGKSICLAEAIARDAHGRLLAHGTSKLMTLNERQTLGTAIETMEYESLPPKFIIN